MLLFTNGKNPPEKIYCSTKLRIFPPLSPINQTDASEGKAAGIEIQSIYPVAAVCTIVLFRAVCHLLYIEFIGFGVYNSKKTYLFVTQALLQCLII